MIGNFLLSYSVTPTAFLKDVISPGDVKLPEKLPASKAFSHEYSTFRLFLEKNLTLSQSTVSSLEVQ